MNAYTSARLREINPALSLPTPEGQFVADLKAILAGECTECDDHDPAPCPKCGRIEGAVYGAVMALCRRTLEKPS